MHYVKRKADFFDIYGTLVKEFIICAFPAYLSKNTLKVNLSRFKDILATVKKKIINCSAKMLHITWWHR
jgi:hypothetical protein